MVTLGDIVQPDATHIKDAAISLDKGLHSAGYVRSYIPTHSAIEIFKRLTRAVLPNAPKESRTMNWHGPYGSGKSHLGVVVGRMLRDGTGSAEFSDLLRNLENLNEAGLAADLQGTFLDPSDRDAKPYFLVSLYRSSEHPIAHQLLEALYRGLREDAKLSEMPILSKTEYDAAYQRFEEIIKISPQYQNAELSQWNLAQDYLTTAEMAADLKKHDPSAHSVFLSWHGAVCHGAPFDPASYGGKKFIEAYIEAGQNLAARGYAGIAIIWDEFGNVLENLIQNLKRNAINEIIELQEFVERACAPDSGHTLFIGLTHVSLAEYGARMGAAEGIKDRLKTIEGRFSPLRVELKASEAEGYHLLGAQLRWTSDGEICRERSQATLQAIQSVCGRLPLFRHLSAELGHIIRDCYPLHPTAAAALFAISTRYAQAARTAFTFFRDLQINGVFSRPVDAERGLFGPELLRLPELLDYYRDSLRHQSETDWQLYERALAEVRAKGEDSPQRDGLLAALLLSKLLGENFQATEAFLAAALYDSLADEPAALELHRQMNWLKSTGLVWKNDLTEVWTLAGETGVETETLIEKKLEGILRQPVEKLLDHSTDMRDDLFPHLGDHDLEPSPHGIVRSYTVGLLTPPVAKLPPLNPKYVATLHLVLATDDSAAAEMKAWIISQNSGPVYFWLPRNGVGQSGLQDKLRRYLAISALLAEESSGEGLKRQLQAKWDKNRQELTEILGGLFGRKGLEEGKAEILRTGDPTPLSCRSWHQFRTELANATSREYSREIHVRNMNLNKVRDEEYLGRKMLTDIIQKVLDFEDNPAYQNDLLGEKDTSEPAAIIDGVFGANELFIRRAKGWDIKKPEETEGAVREVLELIHGEFMKRRAQQFRVVELRRTLLSPPYGLPPVSHALFAAVALRHDQKRIAWRGRGKNRPFAENLSNAFAADSDHETRLEDFSHEQSAMLVLLGLALPDSLRNSDPKQAAANLSVFYKTLPDSVTRSSKLTEPARKLVEFLAQADKTAHALADFLYQLTPMAVEFPRVKHWGDCALTQQCLEELFDSFIAAKDAKYEELYRDINTLLDTEFATLDRAVVLANLEAGESAMARSVSRLLNAKHLDFPLLEGLAKAAVGRTIEGCDDKAMGSLLERLRQTILQNRDSKEGENRAAVREAIENALAKVDAAILTANLEAETNPQILAFATALRGNWQADDKAVDAFIKCCTGKTVIQCSPYDIGGLSTNVKVWVGQHGREKPKPEILYREQLQAFLSSLHSNHACDRLMAEWHRAGSDDQLSALSAALVKPDDDALDELARVWVSKPIAECNENAIKSIEYSIASQLKTLATTLKNRESLGQSVATILSDVPDSTVLLRNLRGDGNPIALALLPLLGANASFNPDALDALVQDGIKKPLGNCDATDIERFAQRIRALVQKHREDRDPSRQLAEDIRAMVAKHKPLVDQERLLEVLQMIIKELQIGQL